MGKFERFEEIHAWQMARKLTGIVYEISRRKTFARDRGLKDQIRRASVSVMSNIAEGFERHTNKEFVQFLYTAKGSLGEVRSQLYVALDVDYIQEKEFRYRSKLIENLAGKLMNLIKYLESH